jgi:hypothetical protein
MNELPNLKMSLRDKSPIFNCTLKISLYIDGDILEYFRRRADPPHAAPYQIHLLAKYLSSHFAFSRKISFSRLK